jgi:predicted enzyme related to lactoylglutathione lyase
MTCDKSLLQGIVRLGIRRSGMRHFFLGLALLAGLLPALSVAQAPPRLPPIDPAQGNTRIPGKFIAFDLATPDLGGAQAFYQDVFGWTYQSPGASADEYVIALNGDRPVAGMFRSEPPGGEQDGATWLALVSVEDVDRAVATATRAGGTVEVQAMTVPDRGRHALLRDPAGAIFGVLTSSSGDPADAMVPIGNIFWVDLFARDLDAVAEFYGQIAPYSATERQIADGAVGRILHAGDRPRAGIVPVDEEANRSAWVPYVRVDDVQAALDRAVDGGGFVIVAPDPVLLDGNLGIFVDPNGGVTGVVKWDEKREDGS